MLYLYENRYIRIIRSFTFEVAEDDFHENKKKDREYLLYGLIYSCKTNPAAGAAHLYAHHSSPILESLSLSPKGTDRAPSVAWREWGVSSCHPPAEEQDVDEAEGRDEMLKRSGLYGWHISDILLYGNVIPMTLGEIGW